MTKELLPFMQAYAEGKKVQYVEGYEWHDVDDATDWEKQYPKFLRIVPAYKPFDTAEECFNEMMRHDPAGWLKAKSGPCTAVHVIFVSGINGGWASANGQEPRRFSDFFNNWEFIDGTPFGKLADEEGPQNAQANGKEY